MVWEQLTGSETFALQWNKTEMKQCFFLLGISYRARRCHWAALNFWAIQSKPCVPWPCMAGPQAEEQPVSISTSSLSYTKLHVRGSCLFCSALLLLESCCLNSCFQWSSHLLPSSTCTWPCMLTCHCWSSVSKGRRRRSWAKYQLVNTAP